MSITITQFVDMTWVAGLQVHACFSEGNGQWHETSMIYGGSGRGETTFAIAVKDDVIFGAWSATGFVVGKRLGCIDEAFAEVNADRVMFAGVELIAD